MLMILNEALGKTRTIATVARELSLNLGSFNDAASLTAVARTKTRRLVLLTEADLQPDLIAVLKAHCDDSLSILMCADEKALRSSERASSIAELENVAKVRWVTPGYDVATLLDAARTCRRDMLRLSKDELERALAKGEFLIQYQPKVERSTGNDWLTREAEALLRWKHSQHGILGPLEFLPELEAFDLMGPVSEFVLRETAQQLLTWEQRDLELNACINLAPSSLSDETLADSYADIVNEYGLDCSRFTFELAEHDVRTSDAPHLRVLQSLRDKGFRVSLDDYGVAAASLSAFERLPFDEIKIHASALKRAKASPVAQQVLAAVTGLAHNLGISVCAEGVEDETTFEFLKTIECDKMQGFVISEAVMPDIVRRCYNTGDPVESVA